MKNLAIATATVLFFAMSATGLRAATIMVDYDAEGDLVDNFAFNTDTEDTSDTKYDRQDGIGTGSPASGGVDLGRAGAVATYEHQSFDLTADGSWVEISHDTLYDENTDTDEFVINRVGLLSNLGDGFGADNRAMATIANLDSDAGAGNEGLHLGWDDNGSKASDSEESFNDDVWYRLTSRFTAVGTDELEIAAEIFSIGADGTDLPSSVLTFSKTVIAEDLRADSTLYAAWKISGWDGTAGSGAVTADNFGIIPEPGTLALLLLGGVAVLTRRRPRK